MLLRAGEAEGRSESLTFEGVDISATTQLLSVSGSSQPGEFARAFSRSARERTPENCTTVYMAAKNMEVNGGAAVTCSTCLMFVILPEKVQHYTCSRCKLVTLLEDKIQLLETQISQVIEKDKKALQTTVEEQQSEGTPMEVDEHQMQKANPGDVMLSSGAVGNQATAEVISMDVDPVPQQRSQPLQNSVVGQGSANRRIHATSRKMNHCFFAAMTRQKTLPR